MAGADTVLGRKAGLGAAAAGMMLIAATYGMARFGVGLFAPYLSAARPELVDVLGWAAAAQFISYSLAATAAARLVDRRPRTGLVLAGATAALGCLGVAVAADPAVFVVAVLVGGMGGGFASPALVPVIDAVVAPGARATAQSVANAGTAVGVIGAGLVMFAATSIAPAWIFMALVCAAATVATWYPVRARTDLAASSGAVPPQPVLGSGTWRALLRPGAAAVVAGAGSSLTWTFGPLLMARAGAVVPGQVGWLWIALGLGGFLGALAGALVERTGRRGAWCLCAAVLALASGGTGLAAATGSEWLAYTSMAAFGAGYMGLSAVLILWARHLLPDNAGAGTSVLFIALAVGQALGSAVFGTLQELVSPMLLAAPAAGLCAAGGLIALPGKPLPPAGQRG